MSPYEYGYDDGSEYRDLKAEDLQLDAQDEQRRTEQAPPAGEAVECPGVGGYRGEPEHCGNDCGGTSSNDGTGERYEAEDCVHCECCFCTPCSYARVA